MGDSSNASMAEDHEETKPSETSMADAPEVIMNDASADETEGLAALGAEIRDQDDVERNVNRQADVMLVERSNERDRKRLERSEREKAQLELQIRRINRRLANENIGPATSRRLFAELSNYEAQVRTLLADIEDITTRIQEREAGLEAGEQPISSGDRLPSESHREFLIRTGKITPFSKAAGGPSSGHDSQGLKTLLLHAETGTTDIEAEEDQSHTEEFRSHRELQKPGFADSSGSDQSRASSKRRKLVRGKRPEVTQDREKTGETTKETSGPEVSDSPSAQESYNDTSPTDVGLGSDSDSDSDPEELDSDARDRKRKRTDAAYETSKKDKIRTVDDGNERLYQQRLQKWIDRRAAARHRAQGESAGPDQDDQVEEWYLPHPTIPDKTFSDDYRIPGDVFPALFDYQKTGVQWLWELYSQRVGGIVGDEMGLGKTIQVIAFLSGLHHSKMLSQPVIVVAPATLLGQWVKEFHTWWPALRVSILHTTGSGMMDVARESKREAELATRATVSGRTGSTKRAAAVRKIVDRVVNDGHVLVTTYSGLQMYADVLIPVQWGYAVLDEGHTIRNPNTSLTIHCKELRTPHRIILSGTPIQNNLVELWSLFDFVFPMRLGNLLDFKNTFEIPIRIGGYANASNLQVQTANKCAEALKDAISPYLLQRNKLDVAADLPAKREKVLFCKLTKTQREAYETFLDSGDMNSILTGKRQVLYGIDILRKICNHPDLQDHRGLSTKPGYNYGSSNKSGKMVIAGRLIEIWRKAGHKTLLFSQHRIMLDILEDFIRGMDGVKYRRMDGSTPITARQMMIEEFNNDPNIHVFLLTTKVGGLGVNLTGADRVIIFDPDWNPSTDMQARERAWRLGQKREVEIYRLMTAGTIEEKIFHRQLFKQFLSNKILKDPKQRQTFQMQDLHDLFSLSKQDEIESETGRLFKGSETRFESERQTPAATAPAPKAPALEPLKKGKLPAKLYAEDDAIQRLEGVSSVRDYENPDEKEKKKDGEEAAAATVATEGTTVAAAEDTAKESTSGKGRNSEQRIMSALFARSGVTAAFEHDQIVNGTRIITADPRMVKREAEKVARLAAEQLQRSAATARTVEAGTVTWTGKHGTAGRPNERTGHMQRAGPSSSTLLEDLKRRKELSTKRTAQAAAAAADAAESRGSSPAAAARAAGTGSAARFMVKIRDFITAHGGRVYTQMLIDQFNWECKTPRKSAEFQAMLKEIAVLERGRGGRGTWTLKDEYKKK